MAHVMRKNLVILGRKGCLVWCKRTTHAGSNIRECRFISMIQVQAHFQKTGAYTSICMYVYIYMYMYIYVYAYTCLVQRSARSYPMHGNKV